MATSSANRNYITDPYNIHDVAAALGWEEVQADMFDLSWYVLAEV